LGVATVVVAGVFVNKFFERVGMLFASFSPLRKVFGVLSLVAIPYMVSVAFGEQAASPLNPRAPVLWFTAAAVNTVIFFWVCEELITTKPLLRILFLGTLGILVVLALRHQVNWAMATADNTARESEINDARNGKNDVMNLKLYSALITPTSNRPEVRKPKRHQTPPAPSGNPIQLSAMFYEPQSPSIVVSNPSGRVADGVTWGMVAFRTSDLSYFGFATQSIGYVKAHSESAPYLLDIPHIAKNSDGNGQIADGDELTGSINIDCPQCAIQTYMVHFVWGHAGWFFESKQKAGYIVPKDMSKDGRSKYIQLFTSNIYAKDRIEIKPRPQ
jgi:hypothetical protein